MGRKLPPWLSCTSIFTKMSWSTPWVFVVIFSQRLAEYIHLMTRNASSVYISSSQSHTILSSLEQNNTCILLCNVTVPVSLHQHLCFLSNYIIQSKRLSIGTIWILHKSLMPSIQTTLSSLDAWTGIIINIFALEHST